MFTPPFDVGPGPGQAGARGGNDASEWVFSRLESMRRPGSFLDGDALSAVRAITDRATVGEGLREGGGGDGVGGSVVIARDDGTSAEAIGASFAGLVRLASIEANRDREETDEALAVLRRSMQQHSAALAKLSGWMLQATEPAAAADGDGGDGGGGGGGDGGGGSGGGGSGAGAGTSPPPPPTGERATELPVSASDQSPFSRSVLLHSGEVSAMAASGTTAGVAGAPPALWSGTGEGGYAAPGEDGGEVMAALELSRESDVLEGQVRRERFRAHRAVDEEIHRTPGLYKEACALGNAMIIQGHDYLSQVKWRWRVAARAWGGEGRGRGRRFDGAGALSVSTYLLLIVYLSVSLSLCLSISVCLDSSLSFSQVFLSFFFVVRASER